MKRSFYFILEVMIMIMAFGFVKEPVAFGKYSAVFSRTMPDVHVTLKQFDLGGASISSIPGEVYDGTAHTPAPVITALGRTLTEGIDYVISYSDNVYAGTATVICTGIGAFSGSIVTTFPIGRRQISRPYMTDAQFVFDGAGHSPNVIYDAAWSDISGTVNAVQNGYYQVNVTLRDPVNTEWVGGGNGPVSETWGIYVCRIGTVLYPWIQTALDTGSSAETPIVLLVDHWAENVENRNNKVNYLAFGAYTWQSNGGNMLTVNSGNVHIVNGIFSGYSGDTVAVNGGDFYFDGGAINCVNNGGNSMGVHVYGGQARLGSGQIYCASGASAYTGFEVCGLQMNGGYAEVNGTNIIVTGGECFAGGIQMSAPSTVVVYNVSIQSSNANDAHSAAGFWVDDGELTVYNASVSVNHAGGLHTPGFVASGTGGTIYIHGGTYSVYSDGDAYGLQAQGTSIYAFGGSFEVSVSETTGSSACGVNRVGGTAYISGNPIFHVSYGNALCIGANNAVVDGGTFYVNLGKTYTLGAHASNVSGGSYYVTAYQGRVMGAFECDEPFSPGARLSGGNFQVYAGGTAEAYGYKDCAVYGGISAGITPLSLDEDEAGFSIGTSDPGGLLTLAVYGNGYQSRGCVIHGGIYQVIPEGIDYPGGNLPIRTGRGYEILNLGEGLIDEETYERLMNKYEKVYSEEEIGHSSLKTISAGTYHYEGEKENGPCILHYVSEGAAYIPEDEYFDPGAIVLLAFDSPEKVGAVFRGWNTQPDGSGEVLQPGELIREIGDLSLYAMWEEDAQEMVEEPLDEKTAMPQEDELQETVEEPSVEETAEKGAENNTDEVAENRASERSSETDI